MARIHILTLSLGFLALVAGGAWLLGNRLAEPGTSGRSEEEVSVRSPGQGIVPLSDEGDSRLNQMQAQMNRLRQGIEAQQSALTRLEQNAAIMLQPIDEGGKTGADNPISEEDQALAEERRQEARLSELEGRLAKQGEDVGWSRSAEGQIAVAVEQVEEALAKDGASLGTKLTDVTCRSSLCRLRPAHGDKMSAERFVEQFPQRLGWRETHGRIQYIPNSAGGLDTVIYLGSM